MDEEFEINKFIGRLHSVSSTLFNREDNEVGRKIWYQYWDTEAWTEQAFWKRFNYAHWNLIKHGYVKNFEEVKQNEFCSFDLWCDRLGEEAVEIFFESYPIEDFDPFK